MRINPVQNRDTNIKQKPSFKGTVSPKFVNYVNALRDDCLVIASLNDAPNINKICNNILAKSKRFMKDYFHVEAELSINTENEDNVDILTVANRVFKKIFDKGNSTVSCGFIGKKDSESPIIRLKNLKFWINDGLAFAEAFSKELMLIKSANFVLKSLNEYKGNGEKFDCILGLCTWWKEHLEPLQKEVTSTQHDFNRNEKLLNSLTSEIEQRKEYLQKNTISYTIREGHLDTVTDNLRGHLLYEILGMPNPDVIYDGRKTDYEMERFLDELLPPIVRKKNLSQEELDDLLNYNIRPIQGTKNSFRGPAGYRDIEQLKPNNLEFVNAEYVYNRLFDEDTEELVEFIKTMQKDNVYVGCQFGQKQTNFVLLANQFFNPMSKDTKDYAFRNESTWFTFESLCDALTPEQKKEMGWTEEFETKFRQKIKAEYERLDEFDKSVQRWQDESRNMI